MTLTWIKHVHTTFGNSNEQGFFSHRKPWKITGFSLCFFTTHRLDVAAMGSLGRPGSSTPGSQSPTTNLRKFDNTKSDTGTRWVKRANTLQNCGMCMYIYKLYICKYKYKYNIYYYKYYIIYMHTACTCTVNKIIKCIIHSDWYPRQTSKRQDDMGLQDSGLYLAASAHHLSPEKDACPPWKTCIGWAKVSSHTDPNSDTCHGSSNVMGFLRCSPFFKNSRNNYGQKTKHVSKHAKTCKNYQFLGSFLNH